MAPPTAPRLDGRSRRTVRRPVRYAEPTAQDELLLQLKESFKMEQKLYKQRKYHLVQIQNALQVELELQAQRRTDIRHLRDILPSPYSESLQDMFAFCLPPAQRRTPSPASTTLPTPQPLSPALPSLPLSPPAVPRLSLSRTQEGVWRSAEEHNGSRTTPSPLEDFLNDRISAPSFMELLNGPLWPAIEGGFVDLTGAASSPESIGPLAIDLSWREPFFPQ